MSNKMKEEAEETLFDFKLKKHKKQKIAIEDIKLIPGFENENYMVESISNLGLLDDNIYLVKEGSKYSVTDGYRRIMGSKKAGETEIMAYVFDSIEDYQGAMITLATNNARSHNPIAELKAIQVLEKRGVKPKTIREYANVQKSKISKLKSLLKLIPGLLQALKKNKITFTMAYEISKLSVEDQETLFAIYEESGKISMDDMKNIRKQIKDKFAGELPDNLFEDFEVDKVQKLISEFNKLDSNEQRQFLMKIGGVE